MAKPHAVGFGEWNELVDQFHGESDRGAAIIAGSFTEHALGTYLIHRVADKTIAEKLFGPVGPLSSFSQRIAVAYAFGLITKAQYREFEAVRQIRNHFAHHPLDASFSSREIKKHVEGLSFFKNRAQEDESPNQRRRIAYLLACGILSGTLLGEIEGARKRSSEDAA